MIKSIKQINFTLILREMTRPTGEGGYYGLAKGNASLINFIQRRQLCTCTHPVVMFKQTAKGR